MVRALQRVGTVRHRLRGASEGLAQQRWIGLDEEEDRTTTGAAAAANDDNRVVFALAQLPSTYGARLGAAVDPECGSDSRTRLEAAMRGIVAHETALSERLLAGLAKMPIARVLGDPMAGPDRQAVFAIALDGVDPGDIVARLAQRRIVIHDRVRDAFSAHVLEALAAESALRVSLAHYNTLDEVDRFLAVLDEAVGEA